MATPSTPQVQPQDLLRMSRDALDALFRRSPAGPIPAGVARGTVILLPGSPFDRVLSGPVRAFCWKGKVFSPATNSLLNRIGPLGQRVIHASVYQGESWFAPGPAVILDYSKTSFVARKIRDEIRLIAPGLYLGQVFWGKRRIALFSLQFPDASP